MHVGRVDPKQRAREVLDATGATVAPGFVDAHAHSDPLGSVEHLLAMGVTTIVVGQDGNSPDERIASYLRRVETARPRINVATLVGHATVRSQEGLGMKAELDAAELARLSERVEQAMDEGALGLSTGLEYDPGSAARPAELRALAQAVGKHSGVVMSHLRSEDDDKIEAAIDELLTQCEGTGAKAHVAHIKVVLGKGAGRAKAVLDQLAAARARGLSVTADVYPYDASYTTVAILFPPYARPPNPYRASVTRNKKRLLEDLKQRVEQRNGPEAMLFGTGDFAGSTLKQVADAQKRPFEQILIDLGPQGGSAAYFVMDKQTVSAFVFDPFVMFGTDGSADSSHPRGAGTFAKVIAEHVGPERPLTLQAFARKASLLPVETLGLGARGLLSPSRVADVIVFAPEEVRDRNSFERPKTPASGMRHVIVAGQIAWRDGKLAPGRGGKALRKAPAVPAQTAGD